MVLSVGCGGEMKEEEIMAPGVLVEEGGGASSRIGEARGVKEESGLAAMEPDPKGST